MSAAAAHLAAGPGRQRDGLLWGSAFSAAVAAHLALGTFLLNRLPEPASSGETLPAVQIDMAPAPTAPLDTPTVAPPQEQIAASAAPDPVMEEVPDVPDPVIPPLEMPALVPLTTAEALVPPVDLPVPELPPPAVVPPTAAVVLPAPAKPAEAVPKPVKKREKVAAKKPKPVRAEEKAERRIERRPAQEATGVRSPATTASVSSGASAASSAAWRSQLVSYLQSRLRYPPGAVAAGAAGVAFSVTRGGQVSGASLTRSSGNPTLDAAALAVFRGSVPPPPAGYAGGLSFNIPIRFTQR